MNIASNKIFGKDFCPMFLGDLIVDSRQDFTGLYRHISAIIWILEWFPFHEPDSE